ncbi:hypothetical protein AYI68_g6844 [Smittium mucronatum]|uniref:Uncharacterized protein n=1 Tax=Smittium mucronatum TaxID=133383 RepID=A0A1R0GQC1_9FUNG|nr:hypothetical protein AYI68_g6844 [Smittium mucronatum]
MSSKDFDFDSLPKGWYWNVQPAKYIYERFFPIKYKIPCPAPECGLYGRFRKDSNGHNANKKAFFRCGSCNLRLNVMDFYTIVLEGSVANLPKATSYLDISPKKPLEKVTSSFFSNNYKKKISSYLPETSTYKNVEIDATSSRNNTFTAKSAIFGDKNDIIKGKNKINDPEIDYNIISDGSSSPIDMINKRKHSLVSQLNSDFSDTPEIGFEDKTMIDKIADTSYNYGHTNKKALYDSNKNLELKLELISSDLKATLDVFQKNRSIEISAIKAENAFIKEKIIILSKKIDNISGNEVIDHETKNLNSNSKIFNNQKNTETDNPDESSNCDIDKNSKIKNSHLLSYKEIAKSQSKSPDDADKLYQAIRKCVGVKPINSGSKAEIKHKISRIYLQGMTSQPLSSAKYCFFIMRFKLSKILNLDFIGLRTLEVTIFTDYAPAFIARVKAFPFLKIIKKFDRTKPKDKNADKSMTEFIQAAYIKRLKKSLEKSTDERYKSYLTDLIVEVSKYSPK